MKAYLWTNVLKNYRSGSVLVMAESAADAWLKLKTDEPNAWLALHMNTGFAPYMNDDDQKDIDLFLVETLQDDYGPNDGPIPIRPEPIEYEISKLPCIVNWGSE